MKDLILLHGAIGSSKQLTPLANLLQPHFKIHTLDFEGHGGRESSQSYSINLFVQNVLDYLDKENIQKVSIFGYSMGGYVALKLAAMYPERVERIITLGTKFDWSPETALKESKMMNPEKIEEKIPKFAEYLRNLHSPLDWKQVLGETANMMIELGNGSGLKKVDFDSIQIPVQIGIGDQDQMVTITESENVAKMLTNSEFKIYPGLPHPIEKVDIEQIKNSIIDFCK